VEGKGGNEMMEEIVLSEMEKEIEAVMTQYDGEKLALWEEIEAREIHEVCERLEVERNELLAEIARRMTEEKVETRVAHLRAVRAKRHAQRMRNTAMRAVINACEATRVVENQVFEGEEKGARLSKRRSSRTLRRTAVWRKNASLRGASRNAVLQAGN
jgi:hypothetical protein